MRISSLLEDESLIRGSFKWSIYSQIRIQVKTITILFLVCFMFLLHPAKGDVIPPNSHYVSKCVLITNISEYVDVKLLGYVRFIGNEHIDTYVINQEECLTKGYKFNTLEIYAVHSTYINGKSLGGLDLPHDKNALKSSIDINPYYGYVDNSNPLCEVNEFYKIAGFTPTSVVLFKWKEIRRFNNGTPEQIDEYSYDDDVNSLLPQIPTSFSDKSRQPFALYPQPAIGSVFVSASSDCAGIWEVRLYTLEGNLVDVVYHNKNAQLHTVEIPLKTLPSGVYSIQVRYGDVTESKLLMVH